MPTAPAPATAAEAEQPIYAFKRGSSDGGMHMKELLGNKGSLLCEMAKLGLNVPPGFTITTHVCQEFYRAGGQLPPGLMGSVRAAVAEVEAAAGRRFGDESDPLLLSVRSGAAMSMPGMMDTVLNLGLNEATVAGLAAKHGERFAYDCYRRLLQMFGDVVLHVPKPAFEAAISDAKRAAHVKQDVELTGAHLKDLCAAFKAIYAQHGKALPQDPWEQLSMGIDAVFRSWNTPRAVQYRAINKVPPEVIGTAVSVQTMVYGNLNDNSGTGVCFTRDPATGAHALYGEWLPNAQGEDVVAGIRTPLPLSQLRVFPGVYEELHASTAALEKHMRDMQDCEFTVQDGQLFHLQTRNGKRTGLAALNVALSMVDEGLVSTEEALMMVEPRHIDQLLHPIFLSEMGYRDSGSVLATGLAASPGAGVGRLVFDAADAVEWTKRGKAVVLCREDTSADDVGGMHSAHAIITEHGGMTSHAAVVARGWGKPCVCGCEAIAVDVEHKTMACPARTLREGDWVSVNGTTGEIIAGKQDLTEPGVTGGLGKFMGWVDGARTLRVMGNADSAEDAAVALRNGAEGVGLCRTEHMFFTSPERIATVQHVIASLAVEADGVAGRGEEATAALQHLKQFQKDDFVGIFKAMQGKPVTIRLLDPPLHEFLPHAGPAMEALCKDLAKDLHLSATALQSRLQAFSSVNPMMGLRGCRLGIVHPEISEVQAAAVFEAAAHCISQGVAAQPLIMVPLVAAPEELQNQAALVRRVAEQVAARTGCKVSYKVGAMLEVPRAALLAGSLAEKSDFLSFGTNDLTQYAWGVSRDDAEAQFLTSYLKHGIVPADPFSTLDVAGVGELVTIAIERARAARPGVELGVCGEHGGDPASIAFFHKAGVDYVSCSPLRVPVARLAAAHAAIKAKAK